MTKHVISENALSERNLISKDERFSFIQWKTLLIQKTIVTKIKLQMLFTYKILKRI